MKDPKPEGKRVCRLNAFRHEFTGQMCVMSTDEQKAYDQHSKITLDALAPVGAYERDIAQSVADDRWRLKRARAIESSLFALGMQLGVDNSGAPQVDDALAEARTWTQDAKNLQLLTIFAQRIQRSVDKNLAYLETIQARRKEGASEAMHKAKLLYRLAQAEGKPYRPEAFFVAAPEAKESVFSNTEVVRELSRARLFQDAINYNYDGKLPKKDRPLQPMEVAAS